MNFDIEYREIAEECNIETLLLCSVFNEDPIFVRCLKDLIEEELNKSSL